MAFSEVIPYLYYDDADAALDWLERVLEFGPSTRWRLGGPSTKEADILIGRSRVSVSGRPPGADEGAGALLIVHVDDIVAYRARVAAADVDAPISAVERQPYGPLTFTVVDPWGYRWNFWQGEADPPNDIGTNVSSHASLDFVSRVRPEKYWRKVVEDHPIVSSHSRLP